jgi:hypothetical protein
MTVEDKIDVIKDRWRALDRLRRTGTRDEYEREAILIYSELYQTWERALEDIADQDRRKFESALTKFSRWLPGHDQAPLESGPVPGSDELKREIDTLDHWVRTFRRRRR